MDWDIYFDDRERQFYGRIATNLPKEYALLESVRDVCFLYEIHSHMRNVCGDDALTTKYTVRAIAEMIEQGLIEIAPGEGSTERIRIQKGPTELDELFSTKVGEFYTVVATDKGREWVSRYLSLSNELNVDWGSLA